MRRLVLIVVPLVLAGCGAKSSDKATTATATADDGKTISGLSIDTDRFKANLAIPGLSFGGDDMDLDGMKLYPGSKVGGVRVDAVDKDGTKKGSVTIDFTAPATPDIVATRFAEEARKAGYTVSDVAPTGLGGTREKPGETNRFALALTPTGATTRGQLTLTGHKDKSDW